MSLPTLLLPTVAHLLVTATTRPDTVPARGACGADSMYTRVPVYVRVTVASRADTVAIPSLLLVAEAVAGRIRVALSGSPDSLPRGDSVFAADARAVRDDSAARGAWTPRADSTGLRVLARRDGALRWMPLTTPTLPSTVLLDRALSEAKQADEVFIPANLLSADSLLFTLRYERSYHVVDGRIRARVDAPVTLLAFTAPMAVEHLAAAIPGTIQLRYPESASSSGASGFVRLSFVVDTTGQAIESTIHDVWPADRPRLTGNLGGYYDAFVRAGTEAVLRGRFYPAEIAGCKVKQLVQLPLTFTLTR